MQRIVILGMLILAFLFIGCEKTTDPEPTLLIIESDPEGALIYLDDEQLEQVTPATIEIEAGFHQIWLELAGYKIYYTNFTLEEEETHHINTSLEMVTTTLNVNSSPSGATITLDGQAVGITPKELDIDPGFHTISLDLAGYESYNTEFSVEEGDTHEIYTIMEELSGFSLTVNTNPTGASIYIDGAYTGYYTPVTFTYLIPGYHFIRIYKPGYNEIVHYVFIEENVPYTINEILTYPVPPYPVFDVWGPDNGEHFNDNEVNVWGWVELDTGASFTGEVGIISINGIDSEFYVDYSGYFDFYISIAAGENELQLRANEPYGDTGTSNIITVYGDFTAPEIEVVLWWNTPTSDLDLHTWNPAGEHCFYGNSVISDGYLDLDDTEGYGPETFVVEIANLGVYEIQVNCYSLNSDDYSDASIQVFFDGALEATYGPNHFIVDDANGSLPGAWWEVCTITVSNGRCTISNDKPTPQVQEKIEFDKTNRSSK
jgi:PEGA domain